MIDPTGIGKEEALGYVGKGWASLIEDFYKEAEKTPYSVNVSCVKEKFGGLQIYWRSEFETDYVDKPYRDLDDFLFNLENKSYMICEECGNHGKMQKRGGWLKTLCKDCFER